MMRGVSSTDARLIATRVLSSILTSLAAVSGSSSVLPTCSNSVPYEVSAVASALESDDRDATATLQPTRAATDCAI